MDHWLVALKLMNSVFVSKRVSLVNYMTMIMSISWSSLPVCVSRQVNALCVCLIFIFVAMLRTVSLLSLCSKSGCFYCFSGQSLNNHYADGTLKNTYRLWKILLHSLLLHMLYMLYVLYITVFVTAVTDPFIIFIYKGVVMKFIFVEMCLWMTSSDCVSSGSAVQPSQTLLEGNGQSECWCGAHDGLLCVLFPH